MWVNERNELGRSERKRENVGRGDERERMKESTGFREG